MGRGGAFLLCFFLQEYFLPCGGFSDTFFSFRASFLNGGGGGGLFYSSNKISAGAHGFFRMVYIQILIKTNYIIYYLVYYYILYHIVLEYVILVYIILLYFIIFYIIHIHESL